MSEIVYYFVPKEHMALTKDQKKLYEIHLKGWVKIIITDSHTIYENKKWYEVNFFTAKTSEVAQLLWTIKAEDCKLLIKKKLYRFKKEYAMETIKSESALVTKLDGLAFKNYGYAFLYTRKEEIEMVIYSDGCEDLDVYVKKERMAEIEKAISTMADKADYFKYEFGEE